MSAVNQRSLRHGMLMLACMVILPLAILIAVGARLSYDSALHSIDSSEGQTTRSLALQLRTGLNSMRRLTGSLGDLTSRFGGPEPVCNSMMANMLGEAPAFLAARMIREDGSRCMAVRQGAGITDGDLDAAFRTEAAKGGPSRALEGSRWRVRYSSTRLGDLRPIMVTVSNDGLAEPRWTSILIVDVAQFTSVIDVLRGKNIAVALYGTPDAPLLVRGIDTPGDRWLPEGAAFRSTQDAAFTSSGLDGISRLYNRDKLGEDDLQLLVGYSLDGRENAFLQYLGLLTVPAIALIALLLLYDTLMKRHVLRWTHELASAARANAETGSARAPENAEMPPELRAVGHSFNRMIERQEQREKSLQDALARNQHLARELHHRVKNSLQIVQSYLGLTKREYSGEARRVLVTTECRVHVLSTGYRLALQNGEMRDVPLDEFFDATVANVSASLRGIGQSIETDFQTDASVEIDHAIPLGLIIVEVLVLALQSDPLASVVVRSFRQGEVAYLAIQSGAASSVPVEPNRLLSGLIEQAGASLEPAREPGTLLTLRLPPS